jgi:hypothetical protein
LLHSQYRLLYCSASQSPRDREGNRKKKAQLQYTEAKTEASFLWTHEVHKTDKWRTINEIASQNICIGLLFVSVGGGILFLGIENVGLPALQARAQGLARWCQR